MKILLQMGILAAAMQLFGCNSEAQVKVGDKIPSFTLQDQDGKNFNVDTVIGKYPLVIYFYPKDETSGCTKEACTFRDSYDAFHQYGAKVIGISGDDVDSHQKFAQHHQLNFTLLADPGNKVRTLFGVPKTMMLPGRVTYIVDKKGVVVHSFNSLTKAEQHVAESLAALKKLSNS